MEYIRIIKTYKTQFIFMVSCTTINATIEMELFIGSAKTVRLLSQPTTKLSAKSNF